MANLNWREIAVLVKNLSAILSPEIEPLFVERIVIPLRPEYPGAYIKGEWAIRLSGKKQERVLLMSARPRHPYLLLATHPIRNAGHATHSAIDLAVSKHLKGSRLLRLETLPRERTAMFWFQESGSENSGSSEIGLVLTLIPAQPEVLLVRRSGSEAWPILARSRTISQTNEDADRDRDLYFPPDGSKSPTEMEIRAELTDLPKLEKLIENEIDKEAFDLRLKAAQKELKERYKSASDRARQCEKAAHEASHEPDWKKYGDLLKSVMGLLPKDDRAASRQITDYETGQELTIPCDPKLSLKDQVTKFYQLAQRKGRRISEANLRGETFLAARARLAKYVEGPPVSDWDGLRALEHTLGIESPAVQAENTGGSKEKKQNKRSGAWLGKTFRSKDGLTIWVGRSRDENLELTFKHARGNDLWMHIRGRPSAHVVIPIHSNKSAPLETLLDAATLTLYYSDGQKKWGKTEVDYTFKKYVKRIKDSTEASYTNNKTLIIEPDPARLKRLLAQADEK